MANRKKRENNKDRLIETTIRHIEKLGADKISLRKIAAECGVTHASIYKHFQDKQALIEATYPYILNRIYPFIQKEIDGRPKENAFLAMCKGYMKFMVTYPQYHYLLHISPSDVYKRQVRGFVHRGCGRGRRRNQSHPDAYPQNPAGSFL